METQINNYITGPFDHLACSGNATRLAPKLITNSAVVFLIQLPQGDLSLTHTPLRGMYTLKNIKLFHSLSLLLCVPQGVASFISMIGQLLVHNVKL